MSECGVCIGGEYDGSCEFGGTRLKHARKAFRCYECRREVGVGEKYEYYAGKCDGDFSTTKTCMQCREISFAFTCGGVRVLGNLWEDMHDYVFPVMATACFERLQTAAAKDHLRSMWMKWKGLVSA